MRSFTSSTLKKNVTASKVSKRKVIGWGARMAHPRKTSKGVTKNAICTLRPIVKSRALSIWSLYATLTALIRSGPSATNGRRTNPTNLLLMYDDSMIELVAPIKKNETTAVSSIHISSATSVRASEYICPGCSCSCPWLSGDVSPSNRLAWELRRKFKYTAKRKSRMPEITRERMVTLSSQLEWTLQCEPNSATGTRREIEAALNKVDAVDANVALNTDSLCFRPPIRKQHPTTLSV